MKKKPKNSLGMLLKMGVLVVAVLVALAISAPSPPLSDAASKQEEAAAEAARAQLEQLKTSITQEMTEHTRYGLPKLEEEQALALTEMEEDQLTPEQRAQLERIRRNLAISAAPLNLVDEPRDDFDSQVLEAGEARAQAEAQARTVRPYIDQELEDRRAQLTAEEARLNLERQSMEQLKADIDRRLEELRDVQKAIETVAEVGGEHAQASQRVEMSVEEREAKVLQVSKILAQMKPASGAQVLGRLRADLAAEIVSKLQTRAAGKLMTALTAIEPQKAAYISALLARQDGVVDAENMQMDIAKELDEALQKAGVKAVEAARPQAGVQPQASTQPPRS